MNRRFAHVVIPAAVVFLSVFSQVSLAGTATFTINATQSVQTISPLIYGVNGDLGGRADYLTSFRSGGNRLTAYNWENNASNAGSDWYFQNDSLMSSSNVPGQAMRGILDQDNTRHAATILTIPMAGYVSADKLGNGDVRFINGGSTPDPNYLTTRFKVSRPTDPNRGTGAFPTSPSTTDGYVNQDEFVNWVKTNYPNTVTDPNRQVIYDLDNEPDLWSSTHAEIHPSKVTYAELRQRTIDYATAIKAVSPNALVFGPVSYGWQGYVNLQYAPDAGGRDFINTYLQQMAAAETAAGKRLVDALDLHYYSEAYGADNAHRVTSDDISAATVAARLQATRSLWDTTYSENSWIVNDTGSGPIQLIPRMKQKIAANYAGTKLALTEYSFGAGGHISGGIAEADALGIFGAQGVFDANYWSVSSSDTFVAGAFDIFRNFNGQGGKFGDTSVSAGTSDVAGTSIYASLDSTNSHRMVLVAINKTASTMTATIDLNGLHFDTASLYLLTGSSSYVQDGGDLALNGASVFTYNMPAYSVTAMELVPEPATMTLLAIGAMALIRRRRK